MQPGQAVEDIVPNGAEVVVVRNPANIHTGASRGSAHYDVSVLDNPKVRSFYLTHDRRTNSQHRRFEVFVTSKRDLVLEDHHPMFSHFQLCA